MNVAQARGTLPAACERDAARGAAVATAQKDINVARYEKTIETAFREVADGLAVRGTYDDEVAAVERYTEAQQGALELSEMRFRKAGRSRGRRKVLCKIKSI